MAEKKKKNLFTYVYALAPEGVRKQTDTYKESNKKEVQLEFISKKTYKQIEKEIKEYNANLPEGEQPRILKVEGYAKAKPSKRNKDALFAIPYINEQGQSDRYEFDVSSKKPAFTKAKQFFFTSEENKLIAITRNFFLPLILAIVLLLGAGGFGIYRYIYPSTNINQISGFTPDIDENINQKQKTEGKDTKNEGIKVEGFSKWTIPAGKTEVSVPLRNPAGNPCYFTFEIILKKTNETLYKSKMVPPGEGIGTVTFNRPLDAGEYDITIMIYTNELETGAQLNSAQLDVEATVV